MSSAYTNPAKVQIKWNKSWALATIRKQIPLTRACVRLAVIRCIYFVLLSAIERFIFNAFECCIPFDHTSLHKAIKRCVSNDTYTCKRWERKEKNCTRTIYSVYYTARIETRLAFWWNAFNFQTFCSQKSYEKVKKFNITTYSHPHLFRNIQRISSTRSSRVCVCLFSLLFLLRHSCENINFLIGNKALEF